MKIAILALLVGALFVSTHLLGSGTVGVNKVDLLSGKEMPRIGKDIQ